MKRLISFCILFFQIYFVFALSVPSASIQGVSVNQPQQNCKTVHISKGWPANSEWIKLNNTLGGRLLAPKPPAIVCEVLRKKYYDEAACDAVGKRCLDPYFYNEDPVSLHTPSWQNDACLPTAIYNGSVGRVCSTRPFPHYVVNASNSEHVVKAVNFARRKGVRLSIKGTGHDYLGKSTSPGLSIWTHHVKGIYLHSSFKPKSCESCEATSTVKIAAGEVWGDVYAKTQKHKVLPVGGASNSVGIGGYLLNGGHSPISARYGLAADNALEMEIGGGSTFGVLISATVKTHPEFPISEFLIHFQSTKAEAKKNKNKNFFDSVAYTYSHVPKLSDASLSGYSVVAPSAGIAPGQSYQDADTADLINGPQLFFLTGQVWEERKRSGIVSSITVEHQASVFSVVGPGSQDSNYLAPGANAVATGWLWSKKALLNKEKLIATIKAMQPNVLSGLMVSGPAVRNAETPDALSVTPAWRRTYLHMSTGVSFPYRNETARREAKRINNDVLTKALIDHAPDMGAYMNEGNLWTPDFQHAFWGDNYDRLLQIKRKYDPEDVFVCQSCVGSERWEFKKNGEVCKATA